MSAPTTEDRSRVWLELPEDLIPLFDLDCVPDPDTRRAPRAQPRSRMGLGPTGSSETKGTAATSARSTPRPQPSPRVAAIPGAAPNLSMPPLCNLPPAKPLPAPGLLPPLKSEGWSFENRRPSRSADPTFDGTSEDDEPDFLRDALKEIEDARAEKLRLSAAVASAPRNVTAPIASASSPILLDLAHPLHAELQQARKTLRGAWVSMILLMLAVVGGIFYTAVRMETSDQHIERLLSELDAERTVSTTYKQEIANLYRELNDVKAEKHRIAARDNFASTAE